jgi:predicted GIY-YIG superfamily endonuclease
MAIESCNLYAATVRGKLVGAWLYILRCADGSYYVGTTRTDLEVRLAQHQSGHFGGYTSTRRPVVLVYSDCFDRIVDAIAAERQIKGWSRAKKEALISGRFDLLPGLSRRRTPLDGAAKRVSDEDGPSSS